MNKYMKEFKEMLLKFQSNYSKHGRKLYINRNELKELAAFVKKVCDKAEMYDDLCK